MATSKRVSRVEDWETLNVIYWGMTFQKRFRHLLEAGPLSVNFFLLTKTKTETWNDTQASKMESVQHPAKE